MFETALVEGSLEIQGDMSDLDAIITALALQLGVDPSEIELGELPGSNRRSALEISFRIYAEPQRMASLSDAILSSSLVSSLASDLQSRNISFCKRRGKQMGRSAGACMLWGGIWLREKTTEEMGESQNRGREKQSGRSAGVCMLWGGIWLRAKANQRWQSKTNHPGGGKGA